MNNLHPIAKAVQSQGRGKDTQLVHMTANEVASMQELAKAHGGSLTINPETGLPEAGFLDSMLPTLLGVGITAATGGAAAPWMIGAGIGALQYARTGDLGKGLMAGLGAYGGAGMAGSLGLGAASAAAPTTAAAAPVNQAAAAANTGIATQGASGLGATGTQAAATNNFLSNAGMTSVPQASVAPQALSAVPQTTTAMPTMMDKLGSGQFWKDNWKYAGAAAAPTVMDMMAPKGTTAPKDNEQFQYDYSPNRASEEDLAAQRAANPQGELTYFRPKYGPRQVVQVAQGGELKYADGGIADEYEYDPTTQTYKKKTTAPMGAVAPVGIAGGDSSGSQPLTQAQIDFLDKEAATPGARDARMGKINNILSLLAPGAIARGIVGGLNSVTGGGVEQTRAPVTNRNTYTPDAVAESQGQSVTADPTGATETYGDTSMGTLFAQGGALRYEDGGPIGAVEPIGIRGNRPMDAGYFKDMAADAARNAVISKLGQAVGLSPQVMALGMAGKGIYNFFNPDQPPAPVVSGSSFPSVPGQNPSGDSGGNGGYTVGDGTQGSASMSDYGGEADLAKGGIAGLSNGGMAKGGFVVPADVVSALGNGSTDAGLRALQAKLGSIKPIKGKGDGLSDSIPTSIDGKQPARVADGEAYIDPKTVANVGGGDPKKGAKKLYAMMDRIRQQAHGKTTQQRKVSTSKIV